MDRTQKAASIEEIKDIFSGAGAVVVTHNLGLSVAEMTDLRLRLRNEGAAMKVVKNTLVKKALAGTDQDVGSDLFSGPVAIAYAPDVISAAKVVTSYAKGNDKFVVLGAIMDDQVLDTQAVSTLASLPSLDELRGKIVGLLQAPATKLAGVTQAPAGQLARVFSAYGAKDAA